MKDSLRIIAALCRKEIIMSTKQTILIVEDETNIANFMAAILQANDYIVKTAKNGQQAETMISSHCPDLILLDLGLPDMDGIQIIKSVRKWSAVPIIVVSARDREYDKVEALDLGADDYITKPFGTSEMLARIRTALRHGITAAEAPNESGIYKSGGLCVDMIRRRVTLDGEELHLTKIEYKIVMLLCLHGGRVLTYDFILRNVWGPYTDRDNQILRVNMANIRRKLEKNPAEPRYIRTEVGVGYRMPDNELIVTM
jgi:two-component system KDP operon response regulator KdpE